MNYDVVFTFGAIQDLSLITLYEIQFTFSEQRAQERTDKLMASISNDLTTFPARNAAKPYGFTDVLRRKLLVGKYAAFYWIDEETDTVYVDRILHSKSNFGYIHFGN